MTKLKFKEIKELGKKDRDKKIQELKIELIKAKANVAKTGSSKVKEIKKTIARLLTVEAKK